MSLHSSLIAGRPPRQPGRGASSSQRTLWKECRTPGYRSVSLRQLLRAAQMAKQATEAETARRRIQDAIEAFLDAIVVETAMADGARAFKLARDALEHFDNYYQGIGDEQRPGTRRRDRSPREDLAQQYRAELDRQPGSALRLRIGPLRPADPLVVIDLVEHAPRASSRERLALATGAGRRYRRLPRVPNT